MRKMLLAVIIVFATLQISVWAEPPAADKERKAQENREEGKGKRLDKKPPIADISAEDREAVKKALQAVWENPEVLQARDEVKRATDAFRQAIKKAVSQENPRVAALVERMHGSGRSREWEKKRPGSEGRGGKPPVGKRPGANDRGAGASGESRGIGPVGFLAFHGDFSKEERKRLEMARKTAMESEEFRKVQEELTALLKQGEGLRKKRVDMFHRTRVEMTRAMIEADPEVKPLLERMEKRKKVRPDK